MECARRRRLDPVLFCGFVVMLLCVCVRACLVCVCVCVCVCVPSRVLWCRVSVQRTIASSLQKVTVFYIENSRKWRIVVTHRRPAGVSVNAKPSVSVVSVLD